MESCGGHEGHALLEACRHRLRLFRGPQRGSPVRHHAVPALSPRPLAAWTCSSVPIAHHASNAAALATRCRYVADRLLSQKARAINPAVVVNVDVHNRRTLPEVKVEYIDGSKEDYGDGMTGVQIIDKIEETTSKMMLDKLLSRCDWMHHS